MMENPSAKALLHRLRGRKRCSVLAINHLDACAIAVAASVFFCDPVFASPGIPLAFQSTSDPTAWQVTANVTGRDGLFSDFLTSGFQEAFPVSGRLSDGIGWIANNTSGTNASLANWTQFVFRQSFDLTGYVPETASLEFQWAADDSGQIFALRGAWVPKYRLNGGALMNGSWSGGDSYALGPVTTVTSGFEDGVNTLDFFVQGNGVTDGLSVLSVALTADPTAPPTPSVPGPIPIFCAAAAFTTSRKLRRRIALSKSLPDSTAMD